MKHLLLLSLFTAFLWSCHKDQDPAPPKTQVELLPPATQEGKRTFGCLIDGKAWTPKAGFVPPPISVSYDEISGKCVISALRNLGNGFRQNLNLHAMFLKSESIDLPLIKSAWIDTSSVCAVLPSIDPSTGMGAKEYWNTNGTLIITKVDRATGIIAGTFEYDAYSPECNDTVKITDGRFDVRYKYQ
jgi:hypothetical protein